MFNPQRDHNFALLLSDYCIDQLEDNHIKEFEKVVLELVIKNQNFQMKLHCFMNNEAKELSMPYQEEITNEFKFFYADAIIETGEWNKIIFTMNQEEEFEMDFEKE